MIITKTPFRISFFGGGSDYPEWFKEHGGKVLSTTIDRYCFITCRRLPPFFKHKSRVIWTKMENVHDVSEIEHPVVRETLKFLKIHDGVEIHHNADLPARAGLGSSSSFTVGLLHALYTLLNQAVDKRRLYEEAIHIERVVLQEAGGHQDQVAVAVGGFNKIRFGGPEHIEVSPVVVTPKKSEMLQNHLMLFFTGFSRISSDVATEQARNIKEKTKNEELRLMTSMVGSAIQILQSNSSLDDFGKLLHESWKLKRSLSSRVSTPHIDEIYDAAMKAGALGGKLLGAGGGGFILFFVKPEQQDRVREKLSSLLHVPFRFENRGSHILHHSN